MYITAGQWHASLPEAEAAARRSAMQRRREECIEAAGEGGRVVAYVSPAGHVDLTEYGSTLRLADPNARTPTPRPRPRDIGADRQLGLF